MSLRHDRVASVLHRAIQRVLSAGLSDPRLDGVSVTVVGVSVDDAVTTAVVRIVVRPAKPAALHALRDAANHIRRRAGEAVALRRMPRLVFKPDRGVQKEAEVLEALAQARRERADSGPEAEPAADANDQAEAAPPKNEEDRR